MHSRKSSRLRIDSSTRQNLTAIAPVDWKPKSSVFWQVRFGHLPEQLAVSVAKDLKKMRELCSKTDA